jgi:flagellar biosynthesis chaperone FliJ
MSDKTEKLEEKLDSIVDWLQSLEDKLDAIIEQQEEIVEKLHDLHDVSGYDE